MIQAKFKADYKTFLLKMDKVEKKEIPYAKLMLRQLVVSAFKLVKGLTPTTKGANIKELWKLKYSKKSAFEEYVVRNLYKNQDILVYMEEGTKPHRIPVGPKGFLTWVDEKTGDRVYTKQAVMHPGTKAYHMVARTERYLDVKIQAYVQQTLSRISKLSSRKV